MRTPIIAGNWKMHKTAAEAVLLAREVREAVAKLTGVDVVLCPPFTALSAVESVIANTRIGLGAQNMYWEEQGAFTGEISPVMLAGLCDYVILGHSERRQFFGETDEGVNKKAKAALAHQLFPIICVGENLQQNEAGETESFVGGQVKAAFDGLSAADAVKVIVAYEPIWAIGTGRAATAQQAQQICGDVVRRALRDGYGEGVAETMRILYGGSTNEKNIAEIMQQPDIDGALIGGASLKAESYAAMVRATDELYRSS